MSDYDLDSDELLLQHIIIINTTGKDSQQQKRGTVFDEHVDCKKLSYQDFPLPFCERYFQWLFLCDKKYNKIVKSKMVALDKWH